MKTLGYNIDISIYVDLKMQDNLRFRSKLYNIIRNHLNENEFNEIETPILTKPTPEGARDYIVPSRVHKSNLFALPQSPQLFKQMLMISGLDKYFQIAPCFRDEDARADRSPGEFYQLDLEMSFVEQEDVFNVVEKLLVNTFKEFSSKKLLSDKFPRLTYKEAMLKIWN